MCDTGRLSQTRTAAWSYGHLPIVAGIIATAVGVDLLIAEPDHALHGVGLAMVLGGPALYLLGESLFRWRMTGTQNAKGLAIAGFLVALAPVVAHASVFLLSLIVAALLTGLAVWERVGRTQIAA